MAIANVAVFPVPDWALKSRVQSRSHRAVVSFPGPLGSGYDIITEVYLLCNDISTRDNRDDCSLLNSRWLLKTWIKLINKFSVDYSHFVLIQQ